LGLLVITGFLVFLVKKVCLVLMESVDIMVYPVSLVHLVLMGSLASKEKEVWTVFLDILVKVDHLVTLVAEVNLVFLVFLV
jgi:hypothetical protein